MEEIKINTEDFLELINLKPTQKVHLIIEQEFISNTGLSNLRIFLDNMEDTNTKVQLTIKYISTNDILEVTGILVGYDLEIKRNYKT